MRNIKKPIFTAIFISLLTIYLYSMLILVLSWGPSSNYENVSVKTTVNITQGYPEILNITCNNGSSVTLSAGSTKTMSCLISIQDFNGGNDINNTNGTFYFYLNQSSDPNDNNTHYTNATCTEDSANGFYVNWTCAFDLMYYANNGSWKANFTVKDKYNMTSNRYTNVTINQLYALNVTSTIDFGNMAVGDTSTTPTEANITNLGNVNINISLYGFGGENEITGAGLAMICDQRNISISNERYAISSIAYDSMTSVPTSPSFIAGLTIPQQTDDSQQEINTTYWRLHVNVSTNPFGVCNGTVIFSAESP